MSKIFCSGDVSLNSRGLAGHGITSLMLREALVPPSKEQSTTFVWILSSSDPQGANRGYWVDVETWDDVAIWYD